MSLSKLRHFDCDKLVDCGDYSHIIQREDDRTPFPFVHLQFLWLAQPVLSFPSGNLV